MNPISHLPQASVHLPEKGGKENCSQHPLEKVQALEQDLQPITGGKTPISSPVFANPVTPPGGSLKDPSPPDARTLRSSIVWVVFSSDYLIQSFLVLHSQPLSARIGFFLFLLLKL